MEGGGGSDDGALQTGQRTVNAYCKFWVKPLDQQGRTFALMTSDQHYVTAVENGGLPGDGSIRTNATSIGAWEKLIFQPQTDGSYTISTPTGYYLMATNGGGVGQNPSGPTDAINTDRVEIGAWETFALEVVPDEHDHGAPGAA